MAIKYSNEILDEAKSLYMDFIPVTLIAKQLDIERSSLQHYVNAYWKEERRLRSAELFNEIVDAKKPQFAQMLSDSEKIVATYLRTLAKKEEVSQQEALAAVKILESVDKITRADKKEDIDSNTSEDKVSTKEEIMEKLKADPFFVP